MVMMAMRFGLAFVLSLALLLSASNAREGDDHGNHGALKSWFDQLASKKGLCCSFADGQSIADVDWDVKDGNYRVRLDGQWLPVPDSAVITEPNRFGPAVVWPFRDADGATQIRCFLPGAGI